MSQPNTSAVVGTAAYPPFALVKGEAAHDIPIEMAAITPMFDWRQLQRWRISEERLPAGSVVRFRKTSPWEQYRGYLVSALVVFCVQMALIVGLLVERTKRHIAERAWRKSEEQYRHVVETQSELICRFTPDTTLTFVNEAYCRYWNKPRNELLGTKFIRLIPEFARADVLAHIDAMVGNPRVAILEHQVLTPDSQRGLAGVDEPPGLRLRRRRDRAAGHRPRHHGTEAGGGCARRELSRSAGSSPPSGGRTGR